MGKMNVINLNGEKVKDINLNKNVFDCEANEIVLKKAIVIFKFLYWVKSLVNVIVLPVTSSNNLANVFPSASKQALRP